MSGKIETKQPKRKIPVPNLCRICLTSGLSMETLTEKLDSSIEITILEALEKVMCCEMTSNSDIPKHICTMCLSLLRLSYNLRVQFDETQKKILGKTTEECGDFDDLHYKQKGEVELVIGNEKYGLNDILIVEEEEIEDYSQFFENLGHNITLEVKNHPKETSDDKHEYETILVEAAEDSDDEINEFHWEHEYAINSSTGSTESLKNDINDIKNYDKKKLLETIDSLIIEGDVDINERKLPRSKTKSRKKKAPEYELEEIEKYILVGEDSDKVRCCNKKNIEHNKLIDEEIISDVLVQEALNSTNVCKICSEKFATRNGLEKHLYLEHCHNKTTDEKIFSDNLVQEALNSKNVCKICAEKFATRSGLEKHLYIEHCQTHPKFMEKYENKLTKKRLINNLLCQICGYVSKSHGGARYHMITHGERLFSCDLCGRKFFTSYQVKNHKAFKHQEKKPSHLCPLCGEYRNSESALAYHLKSHSNDTKKLPCSICDTKFLSQSALNMHLRRHKGERRFPCNFCGKSFFNSFERKKHLMIHTGERPYKCKYCDKRFITGFNQKVHMMTHDGPYYCEYCHKTFIDEDMLNFHLKIKHKIALEEEKVQKIQEGEDISMKTPHIFGEYDLINADGDSLGF